MSQEDSQISYTLMPVGDLAVPTDSLTEAPPDPYEGVVAAKKKTWGVPDDYRLFLKRPLYETAPKMTAEDKKTIALSFFQQRMRQLTSTTLFKSTLSYVGIGLFFGFTQSALEAFFAAVFISMSGLWIMHTIRFRKSCNESCSDCTCCGKPCTCAFPCYCCFFVCGDSFNGLLQAVLFTSDLFRQLPLSQFIIATSTAATDCLFLQPSIWTSIGVVAQWAMISVTVYTALKTAADLSTLYFLDTHNMTKEQWQYFLAARYQLNQGLTAKAFEKAGMPEKYYVTMPAWKTDEYPSSMPPTTDTDTELVMNGCCMKLKCLMCSVSILTWASIYGAMATTIDYFTQCYY